MARKGQIFISYLNKFSLPVILFCLLSTPLIAAFIDTLGSNPPDQYIGKDFLISKVNNLRFHLLRDKIFTGLYVGENDWLVFTHEFSLDDYQNTKKFSVRQL